MGPIDDTSDDTSGGEAPAPRPEGRGTTARGRSWMTTAAIATGLAIGAAGVAGAATGGSGSGSSSTSAPSGYTQVPGGQPGNQAANGAQPPNGADAPSGQAPNGAQAQSRQDPATVDHGPGETLLTGDTATKVTDAALAKYPGATVIRVETDSGDAAYEAHLRKTDGTTVTVLFDQELHVTGTEDGFGPGPQGAGRGGPPSAPGRTPGASASSGESASSSSSSTT
jgi:hypothetical protein